MSEAAHFEFKYEVTRSDVRDWERASSMTWWDWLTLALALLLLGVGSCYFVEGRNADGMVSILAAGVVFRTGKSSSPTLAIFMSLLRMRIHLEIDEDEVRINSFVRKSEKPSQTESYRWLDLARDGEVRERETWFAFTIGRRIRFAIPERVFAANEQIQEFREFVRGKMGDRCQFASSID